VTGLPRPATREPSSSASPQPHHSAIGGDPDAVAIAHRGAQHRPQAIHVRCQLDSSTDDLTGMGVRPEAGVVVADAELLTLPGDDERVGALCGDRTTAVMSGPMALMQPGTCVRLRQ
jgi:hypothetical protein